MTGRWLWALGLGACLLAGCAAPVERGATGPDRVAFAAAQDPQQTKIDALAQALMAMGPGVDPGEARRAAEIAVLEPLQWAVDWQVTDSPLVHNFKVNNGMRPRGLCKDWADDLEMHMRAQRFATFDLHRAIANSRNVRLEHSALILSAKGAPMESGIVLDPWRKGQGRLFFVTVSEDPRYHWDPRAEVFAWKRDWQARVAAENAAR